MTAFPTQEEETMKITSTRRLFLAGSGIVGGAAALAACGGQQTAEEQQKQAEQDNQKAAEDQAELPSTAWERMDYDQVPEGGTLTLAVSQLPNNWNSNQTDGNLADLSTIRGPLGAGAFISYSETGEKTFNPDYVESAEVTNEDPQTVTLKFNKDAKWEDGSPIVIEDLISQWKANSGKDKDFQLVSTVGWDQVKEIKQTDDEFSGEIVFDSPYIDWITLCYPDIPKKVSETADSFNTGYVKEPTPSCGPYVVEKIDETGGVVTMKKNENWWGRAPKLETIIFTVVDQTTQPQSFANGELDVVEIANGDVLSQAKTRGDASIQKTNGLTWTHLTLNTQGADGNLEDVKVREALFRGIDREAIGRAVVGPLEAPVQLVDNYYYMPGQDGYEDSFGGLTFDQDAAGKLLDEAGWTMDGDKRKKDGKTFDMSIIIPADTKSNSDRARQVQTNLNQLGLNIELQTVPSDAYFDDYILPKQYDAVTFSWVGSQYPESSSANLFYPKDAPQNFTNYADDTIGPLVKDLTSNFDADARKKIANEISTKIAQSYVVLPFYATPTIWGVKDGIVNYGAALFESVDWTQVGVKA